MRLKLFVLCRDLYYTDRGVHPGIYVYNLHMWHRRKILTENMVWPNALAIDFEGKCRTVIFFKHGKFFVNFTGKCPTDIVIKIQ